VGGEVPRVRASPSGVALDALTAQAREHAAARAASLAVRCAGGGGHSGAPKSRVGDRAGAGNGSTALRGELDETRMAMSGSFADDADEAVYGHSRASADGGANAAAHSAARRAPSLIRAPERRACRWQQWLLRRAFAHAPASCRCCCAGMLPNGPLWACTLTALTTSVAVGVSMPVPLSNYIRRQCGEATRPSTSAPADEHKGPPWLACTSCNQSRRTCLRISLSPNARPSTDGAHGAPIKEGYLSIRYVRYVRYIRYTAHMRQVRQG
jgi:hypothetical protein